MPKAYEKIKRAVGGDKGKAARIYIGQAKTKAGRSRRAKSLQHGKTKSHGSARKSNRCRKR